MSISAMAIGECSANSYCELKRVKAVDLDGFSA